MWSSNVVLEDFFQTILPWNLKSWSATSESHDANTLAAAMCSGSGICSILAVPPKYKNGFFRSGSIASKNIAALGGLLLVLGIFKFIVADSTAMEVDVVWLLQILIGLIRFFLFFIPRLLIR
jgi:hypothetical protein